MGTQVRSLMTAPPRLLPGTTSVVEAAEHMGQEGIGDVLVALDGGSFGILTDRDVAVRVVAEGRDPAATEAARVCSREVATLAPDAEADEAVRLMRERAVRRLPVVEDGRCVGIVSLGDLAVQLDRDSALAEVSAAPANA